MLRDVGQAATYQLSRQGARQVNAQGFVTRGQENDPRTIGVEPRARSLEFVAGSVDVGWHVALEVG
jgi:hypothetical protein